MQSKFACAIILVLDFDDSNINGISAPDKFIVDDILHEMRLFLFLKPQPGIPHPHVFRVIL